MAKKKDIHIINDENARAEMLKVVNKNGKRAVGRSELIKFLEGNSLTARQKFMAQCYYCMGFYVDGKVDCEVYFCPLHRDMPYRGVFDDTEVSTSE